MPRAWIPFFAVFVVAAVGTRLAAEREHSRFAVPNVPDLTITTRETVDLPQSTVQTTTLYFKGAWQRTERYLEFPSGVPGQRTARFAMLTRCDDRRTVILNHDELFYRSSPLEDIDRSVSWVRSWWGKTPASRVAGADVKIIVNTVDTGERRQLGPFSARHVITTTTTNPSPDATTRASESVEDGWYVDLPPPGCRDGGDAHAFAIGSVVRPGASPDRVTVEFRGARRGGFPIEQTRRDEGTHGAPITTRVTLIEFSEAALDTSLFDVPAGYRPALPRIFGGFDLTKPDTLANRLTAFWDDASTLARDFFRF